MFERKDFSVEDGRKKALEQLDYYERKLETQEQRVNFRTAYAHLVLTSPEPQTGCDVPRGGAIERLYFLAKGLTTKDHDDFLKLMD